jgi:hypothetical protein
VGRRRANGLLDDVLGVEQLDEEIAAGLGYLVAVGSPSGADSSPSRVPVRDDQLTLDVRDATTLYEVQPMWDLFEPPQDVVGSPSITRNAWGRGIADHIAPRLGRLRHRYELFESVQLLHGLLERSQPSIRAASLGPDVSLHVWETPADTRVFLVNMTSVDRSGRCSPLAAQKLVVPLGAAVRSHRGARITTSPSDDGQIVEIDHLGAWDCLVVSRP